MPSWLYEWETDLQMQIDNAEVTTPATMNTATMWAHRHNPLS
ncbi:MAG: hypothetical protein ACLRJV_15020 [Eubacteriales bacterium]